ncbi:conserved hypothetical protein [Methanococcus maripaludis C5]|uniref:Uncharacterized protein n=1 Tax=Methanococcus maripaludis (strain C5 / ATCC BAA-1333) TaxID=402880 RepID=A4FYJ1_METM5|nr:hypothetical protein [Methanococcus maripaludis]ABO35275.1 conserved hypothetical protein [Methanococcus maripaludis C5]
MVKRYLDEEDAFIEQFGQFFESTTAFPRIAGRIFAYLLICDPPYTTAKHLIERLNVSKSSVSNMIKLLLKTKLIGQISFPGERERYYQVKDNCLESILTNELQAVSKIRVILNDGKNLLDEEDSKLSNRIIQLDRVYGIIEEEIPIILKKYRE